MADLDAGDLVVLGAAFSRFQLAIFGEERRRIHDHLVSHLQARFDFDQPLVAHADRDVAQLALVIPSGYTGKVNWPMVLWDVQGSGSVLIGGAVYAAGSTSVATALQGGKPPPNGVEITEAIGPITLVYLANPVRLGLTPQTEVGLTSLTAWALDVRCCAFGRCAL